MTMETQRKILPRVPEGLLTPKQSKGGHSQVNSSYDKYSMQKGPNLQISFNIAYESLETRHFCGGKHRCPPNSFCIKPHGPILTCLRRKDEVQLCYEFTLVLSSRFGRLEAAVFQPLRPADRADRRRPVALSFDTCEPESLAVLALVDGGQGVACSVPAAPLDGAAEGKVRAECLKQSIYLRFVSRQT